MSTSLESLVSEGSSRPADLTDILARYIRLSFPDESVEVHLLDDFYKLSTTEKILIALLTEKAVDELGKSETDTMGPNEIAKRADVAIGEAYPLIRSLEKNSLIENTGREYRIPDRKFNEVGNIFTK